MLLSRTGGGLGFISPQYLPSANSFSEVVICYLIHFRLALDISLQAPTSDLGNIKLHPPHSSNDQYQLSAGGRVQGERPSTINCDSELSTSWMGLSCRICTCNTRNSTGMLKIVSDPQIVIREEAYLHYIELRMRSCCHTTCVCHFSSLFSL